MKRALVFFLPALCAFPLAAAEPATASFEVTTTSQYVWRGLVLTNGPVLQSSTTAGVAGLHLNVFTNLDLGNQNQRRRKISELDYDAGYDKSLEKVTLSGGVIHYTFPNTEIASTTELYGGARLAMPMHPSVKVYADVGAIDGAYASFDVSHAFELPKLSRRTTWSAELSAGFGAATSGFNKGYFGVARSALVDFHPGLAMQFGFGSHLHITPRIGYSSIVDSTLRESAAAEAHNLYYGITLSLAF